MTGLTRHRVDAEQSESAHLTYQFMTHTRALKLAGDDSWVKRNCSLSKCVHIHETSARGEKHAARADRKQQRLVVSCVWSNCGSKRLCNKPAVRLYHAHTHTHTSTHVYLRHITFTSNSHSILCFVVFSRADCSVPQAPAPMVETITKANIRSPERPIFSTSRVRESKTHTHTHACSSTPAQPCAARSPNISDSHN